MNEQTAAPTHFSRKEVRQYCTFEGTDAKSGRVCSHFSLHAFGRSEDDWAFASQTPRWYHVALSLYTDFAYEHKWSGPPVVTAGRCRSSGDQG